MKKTILFATIVLSGCVMDAINVTHLVNNTGNDIEIEVQFDTSSLAHQKTGSYYTYMQQRAEAAKHNVVAMDSSMATIIYKVENGQRIELDRGRGPKPDFHAFRYVVIRSAGRSVRYSSKELPRMVHKKGGDWEWVVN